MNNKGGLPLSTLLWVDRQYSAANALSSCLGDAYLNGLNPIFRGIREECLRLGVRFREAPNSLGRTYAIAPMFALDRILGESEIPYRGDVELLQQLSAKRSDLKLDLAELRGFVTGHRILHEPAHVVADRVLRSQWTPSSRYSSLESTLRSLLGEAFANSVEAIGTAFAENGTHRVLWEWNAYIHFNEPQFLQLRACREVLGPTILFELAMWVFFHLNVRAETSVIGPGYVAECTRQVLENTHLSPGERRLAESIGPALFGLNPHFRSGTTTAYFRLLGDEEGLRQARAIDLDSPEELYSIGLPRAVKLFSSLISGWVSPCASETATANQMEELSVCQ